MCTVHIYTVATKDMGESSNIPHAPILTDSIEVFRQNHMW